MNYDAVLFMINRMTFITRKLANGSFRYPSLAFQFLDFCVTFLNKCGLYVAWDDFTNSWKLV